MNERNNLLARSDSNETVTTPLQPMSLVDILDGMFSLYRSHFQLYFRIAVVYLVFGFMINLISVFIITSVPMGTSMVIATLTFVVSTLFAYWVVGGLAYASAQVYLNRDITSQAALQRSSKCYFSLIGSTFVYYLVVMCLSITVIGIPFAIYFAFRWGLYILPVLFEEGPGSNALRRSTELVKGTWWRVCGIMVAVSLIAIMIGFILQTCFTLIFSSVTGNTGAEAVNLFETFRRLFAPTPNDIGWGLYIMHTLGSLLIAGITMPIATIGSSLLYFDLRIRKEAFDIEMQATH